jgi:hypothetical protein
VDHREKLTERWSSAILRTVVPTHDFAQPSEESIGDTHKKIAKAKRTNEMTLLEGAGVSNMVTMGQMTPIATDADLLKIEDQTLFGSSVDLHPIIFEEAYVKDAEPKFVQLVKNHSDVYTEEQILALDGQTQPKQLM